MNFETDRIAGASTFLHNLESKPYFALITRKYQGKVARRSGVSYMNHIREGALILYLLYGAEEEDAIGAYCLHPIFQSDTLLMEIASEPESLNAIPARMLLLGMEYRRVANNYTIKDPVREPAAIDLGPLDSVHRMLTADKIQNRKDFLKYIYRAKDRASYQRVSERSLQYFDSWLARLGVSEEMYTGVVAVLESSSLNEIAFHVD